MRNWIRKQVGQQLVLAALLLPILLAMLGVVADLGMVYARRQQAQNAADAAALAGVSVLCTNSSLAEPAAQDYVTRNGFAGKAAVSYPAGSASFTSYIRVQISDSYRPAFARLVWPGTFPVRSSATAGCKSSGGGGPILVLDPHSDSALQKNGSSNIVVHNGNIHVNSDHATKAVNVIGSGWITTETPMTVVGGVRKVGSGGITPAAITGAAPLEDPLKDLQPPTGTGCTTYANPNITGSGNVHLSPGIYSNGLNINGSGSVTFDTGSGPCAGMYIIRGAAFKVSGSRNLYGDNLFFYIDENSRLWHTGSGLVSFSASTSGPYPGVLFFQARTNTTAAIWSGSPVADSCNGILYFPNAQLALNGSGVYNINFIVYRLDIDGSALIDVQGYSAAGVGTVTWALTD